MTAEAFGFPWILLYNNEVFAINEDLNNFIGLYSSNHYEEVSTTRMIICENCSMDIFIALVNDDKSVCCKCINCSKLYDIGVYDSSNNTAKEAKCNSCNGEELNLMHGIAYGEYNQNWEYVVGKCIECQGLLVVSDWHST